MDKPIKIIITDDQNLFREGLKLILSSDSRYEIIGEAENGQKLIDLLPSHQADVVLLDYTMPVLDGFETMKIIKEKYPLIKVLILTMHYDESLMVFLMEQGANGYLLKDEDSEVVKEAINAVYEEGQYFSAYVSKAILNQLRLNKQSETTRKLSNQDKGFSRREIEILEIIGQCNRREMSDRLFISIKTIDFHLKNLRDKTNSSSTAELVRFAIKNGYQA